MCGYSRETYQGLRADECDCARKNAKRVKSTGDCGCGCGGIHGEKGAKSSPVRGGTPSKGARHAFLAANLAPVVGGPRPQKVEGKRVARSRGMPIRPNFATLDYATVGRYSVVDSVEGAVQNRYHKWRTAAGFRPTRYGEGGNLGHN